MSNELIIDSFAGPGGWDQGLKMLGYTGRVVGIEWDTDACKTGIAAGHERVQLDVREARSLFNGETITGKIDSPPCGGFSVAGKGKGRVDAVAVLGALEHVTDLTDLDNAIADLADVMTDERTTLVLEPLRWALVHRPRWLAWEQVPAVQPLWDSCAVILRAHGYSVDTDVLNAEQYGMIATCPLHSPAEIVTRFSVTNLSRVTADGAGPDLSVCLDDAKVAARRATFVHQFNVVESVRTGNGITSTLQETVESAWNVAWMLRAALADAADATWHGLVHDLAQRVLSELPIRIGRAGDVSTSADTYVSASTGNTVANTASWPSNTWGALCALARSYTTSTEPPTTTNPKTSLCSAATHTICSTTGSVAGVASCGVCTDYAVPQTRKRAVLVAHRELAVALPTPTHSRYYSRSPGKLDPGVLPWVSMAEALGWDSHGRVEFVGSKRPNAAVRPVGAPAPTIIGGNDNANRHWRRTGAGLIERDGEVLPRHDRELVGLGLWPLNGPATTVCCDSRIFPPGGHHSPGAQSKDSLRVTVAEASVLQTFPADYPWQGSKTSQYQQIGNAIPPLLAAAVLRQVIDET